MIHRTGMEKDGVISTHVLFDKIELMQRIKSPKTLKVLMGVQILYELRRQREMAELDGTTETGHLIANEVAQLSHIMTLVRSWLQPPITVNFLEKPRGKISSSKSRRRANGKRR